MMKRLKDLLKLCCNCWPNDPFFGFCFPCLANCINGVSFRLNFFFKSLFFVVFIVTHQCPYAIWLSIRRFLHSLSQWYFCMILYALIGECFVDLFQAVLTLIWTVVFNFIDMIRKVAESFGTIIIKCYNGSDNPSGVDVRSNIIRNRREQYGSFLNEPQEQSTEQSWWDSIIGYMSKCFLGASRLDDGVDAENFLNDEIHASITITFNAW